MRRKLEEFEEHMKVCPLGNQENLPDFVKLDIKKRRKKTGQRNDHKGYSRKIPERIDVVKSLVLSKHDCCPECGKRELSNVQEIRFRYVTNIPEPQEPITTEYEIHRCYCRNCKKLVELPILDALPNARFGLRVMLLVVFMKVGLALPSQKIIKMLEAQYNLTISDGEVYKMLEQAAQAFGPDYKKLEQKIRDASVKHIDETGWRIDGKNHWLWIFINKEIALYVVRKQRSSSVPIKLLGKQKDKVVVNDRYNAYNVLVRKTKCKLQICWTHLLRNAKDLAEHYDEAKYIRRQLKHIFKLANKCKHQAIEKQVDNLLHKIDLIAEKRYNHSEVRKFVKSVCNLHRENLFRFVTNPEIEATNNRAERGIRKAVIIRKISNGNRSKKGADIFGVLLSIVETLNLQGKNPLNEMNRIIQTSEK